MSATNGAPANGAPADGVSGRRAAAEVGGSGTGDSQRQASGDDAGHDSADRDDELRTVLRSLQRLIVRYPFAAQALFASLVREGREFAATDEGRRWAERLAPTELMRQGRAVWEAVTLNALEDDPDAILPSKFLEAFVSSSKRVDLEGFLASILEQEGADSKPGSASRAAPSNEASDGASNGASDAAGGAAKSETPPGDS